MPALFITATGTGIGKTAITALLARQLLSRGKRPRLLKPVLSGFDATRPELSDAGVLLSAVGHRPSGAWLDRMSPWRFDAPLSPDMAAAREGRDIPFDKLVDYCRSEIASSPGPVLIEGVGGAMVPLDDRHLVIDWMAALGLPALIVSGTYLGAISHALASLAAIEARGVQVAAMLLNTSADQPVPAEETARTIARFTDVPVYVVPRLAIGANGVPATDGAPDLTSLLGPV